MHIGKKMSKEEVSRALKKLRRRKLLNAKKFCGAIKWNEDGLKFQKRLRNEWG